MKVLNPSGLEVSSCAGFPQLFLGTRLAVTAGLICALLAWCPPIFAQGEKKSSEFEFLLTYVGSTVVDREGQWVDYLVQITNRTSAVVWIPGVSTPGVLSSYISERNPQGFCFYLEKHRGLRGWTRTFYALSSNQVKCTPLATGEGIAFRIPVRIDIAELKDARSIRMKLFVYGSRDLRDESERYSNALPFPPVKP